MEDGDHYHQGQLLSARLRLPSASNAWFLCRCLTARRNGKVRARPSSARTRRPCSTSRRALSPMLVRPRSSVRLARSTASPLTALAVILYLAGYFGPGQAYQIHKSGGIVFCYGVCCLLPILLGLFLFGIGLTAGTPAVSARSSLTLVAVHQDQVDYVAKTVPGQNSATTDTVDCRLAVSCPEFSGEATVENPCSLVRLHACVCSTDCMRRRLAAWPTPIRTAASLTSGAPRAASLWPSLPPSSLPL